MGQIHCICTAGPERDRDFGELLALVDGGYVGFSEKPGIVFVYEPLDIGLHQSSPRSKAEGNEYVLKQYGASFGEC